MAIQIKNATQSSTFIQSTGTVSPGDAMPAVIFTQNDWNIVSYPLWITNRAPQREGNFQHYTGSDDRKGSIMLHLYGSTRAGNLAIVQAIKEPIYLNADDIDTNVSGLYTMRIEQLVRNESARLISLRLGLTGYNN
jgi:hypothetical protein